MFEGEIETSNLHTKGKLKAQHTLSQATLGMCNILLLLKIAEEGLHKGSLNMERCHNTH